MQEPCDRPQADALRRPPSGEHAAEPSPGEGASKLGSGPATACERIALCQAADLGAGQAMRIECGELTLAVFNLDGEFHVTDDACTHGPGSLSEGHIEGDLIVCDFHGGAFNIRTGEVAEPPCMVALKTYRTVVDGDGFVSIEV